MELRISYTQEESDMLKLYLVENLIKDDDYEVGDNDKYIGDGIYADVVYRAEAKKVGFIAGWKSSDPKTLRAFKKYLHNRAIELIEQDPDKFFVPLPDDASDEFEEKEDLDEHILDINITKKSCYFKGAHVISVEGTVGKKEFRFWQAGN